MTNLTISTAVSTVASRLPTCAIGETHLTMLEGIERIHSSVASLLLTHSIMESCYHEVDVAEMEVRCNGLSHDYFPLLQDVVDALGWGKVADLDRPMKAVWSK